MGGARAPWAPLPGYAYDSTDSTTKHQYSFLEFIVSKQLVFGDVKDKLLVTETEVLKFNQKLKSASLMSAAGSLEEDIKFSILEPVEHCANNLPT